MRNGNALAIAILLGLASCATAQGGGWTAKQIATLRGAGFVHTDRGWEFNVSDRLLFPTDDSDINADQATTIGSMAQHLLAVDVRHAEVEGHTDRTGTTQYNDALSVRRAAAVASVMERAGFAHDNLKVVGLGERFPVETNATAAGRQENRRVVILITAP
jgi:OOP family OmpA-OmpF porin